MKLRLFTCTCVLLLAGMAIAQENMKYQKPPAVIEKLVLATFNPAVSFNEAGDWMLILKRNAAPTIEDLAQPELRIAGMRLNPANFSPSRSATYAGLSIKHLISGKEMNISNMPANIKIANVSWNSAGTKFAFTQENRNSVDLYVVDVKTLTAVKVNKTPLNIISDSYTWYDNESIIYYAATSSPDAMPKPPVAPGGPVIQQNLGKVAASRTYQDLIKNKYDEDLFRFFSKAQLTLTKNGVEKHIGKADYFKNLEISPDKKYLLVERLQGNVSYLVPYYGFASHVEIWEISGQLVKKVADRPSSELAPSGFDNVLDAPRSFSWVDTKPNTLGWIEPLDGGLIKKEVKDHDAYVVLSAPFTSSPSTIAKTAMRMYEASFINQNLALITQGSYANQRLVWQLLDLKTNKLKTLSDRSSNDAYADPGTPFTVKNEYGRSVPIIYQNTKFIMRNSGASPKGDYPYISSFDFNTLKTEKLWQSQEPYYEVPMKLLSHNKGLNFITYKQSATEAPNLYLLSNSGKSRKAITNFPDPQPELRKLDKKKITYQREDGVQLSANLYLPKDYNEKKDGKLPVVIVAYPIEYKSASDAAQVRGSKNTFTLTNYGSFVPFALMGYAVMDNTEFPIVGEGSKYPNDSFVEQLEMNARAAINKVASMGIGDSTRVGVAGHSYGAFMTANLLAHTNLFKAGIARSGAYNRTLTPFGFQGEERTYWQAPEVYNRMSPFAYAHKIKTPLLLIHGEADNNPGTFPIQSERLYNAIKGHGGTVRFVQLPYESHGYSAKENILHLMWEEYQWLEKYVKSKSE